MGAAAMSREFKRLPCGCVGSMGGLCLNQLTQQVSRVKQLTRLLPLLRGAARFCDDTCSHAVFHQR